MSLEDFEKCPSDQPLNVRASVSISLLVVPSCCSGLTTSLATSYGLYIKCLVISTSKLAYISKLWMKSFESSISEFPYLGVWNVCHTKINIKLRHALFYSACPKRLKYFIFNLLVKMKQNRREYLNFMYGWTFLVVLKEMNRLGDMHENGRMMLKWMLALGDTVLNLHII
jgi:hypothetical protein